MLLRTLFRTAWKYKAQFISMIIMVAIGVGIFVGFNMEWYSLEKNTGDFFTQTDLYHYRVMNEQGFTVDDVTAIGELSDNGVYAHRVLQVNVDVPDKHNSVSIWCEENERVSAFYNTSGSPYNEHLEGFWLSDKYAEANGYKVGDTFTISYRGVSISAPIRGLGKSGEYAVCVADGNQLMPDLSTFGFAFVTPVTIETAFRSLPMMGSFTIPYPMICFNADITKEEAEQKVSEALGKTTLLLSLDEHTSYAAVQGEIEEGQTMVSVLPVLFLLIGALTMITTMHRVTANEKTQIGTLKALGFKNRKIIRHYTAYGLFIGIVGAVLGVALGIGICAFIINPNGMMGTYIDMPKWGLYAPWWTWLVLAGIVAFLTLISFLSVKKMLKGTAADALRPYVLQKVKPLAIEKTKAWNKMSFATKWNLRDVFRHNGIDIDEIDSDNLLQNVTMVSQVTYLFDETIEENLRIAKPNATQEEIENACRLASVHEFILSLPGGYQTEVGALGDNLSAGEKQRIGLARAFLSGAELILLDEPTSNVDSINEGIILKALTMQKRKKSILLVSHRESTMAIADRIYKIKDGKITEEK